MTPSVLCSQKQRRDLGGGVDVPGRAQKAVRRVAGRVEVARHLSNNNKNQQQQEESAATTTTTRINQLPLLCKTKASAISFVIAF